MDDSSYASTLYNNQMKKVTLLTPEQKQERFNNAEQACVGLTASEIFQISFNKHWKQMNYHISVHSRDLASYASQVAKKMSKSDRWWADRIRQDVSDISRSITDANYIRIDGNTSNSAFHKRITAHNRTLLYLDYFGSDIDTLFRSRNDNHSRMITDKQFDNLARKSHYLRMCVVKWTKSDKDRWNKLKSKKEVTQTGH